MLATCSDEADVADNSSWPEPVSYVCSSDASKNVCNSGESFLLSVLSCFGSSITSYIASSLIASTDSYYWSAISSFISESV